MGIFCTVRAFMRFRGREALRDTYQKHGGVPVIVNQESDNWRVPRSNPSEQIGWWGVLPDRRSEEHTSELQSQSNLVCRLLLEKKIQCAPYQIETPAALRRVDPGELPARFRVEQLAEQRPATAMADFPVWVVICHALSYFR